VDRSEDEVRVSDRPRGLRSAGPDAIRIDLIVANRAAVVLRNLTSGDFARR
jgi:hypothetical protein